MPFIFSLSSKGGAAALENLTTNATGNTENDFLGVKPGASRLFYALRLAIQGKANAATALSGIVVRMKQWTSTASSGGQSLTPQPKHNLAPAAVQTAVITTTAQGTVTSGTGGPNIVGLASCGASGPGGWVAANPDDIPALDGGATKSLDLFSSSPTAAMSFESILDTVEG